MSVHDKVKFSKKNHVNLNIYTGLDSNLYVPIGDKSFWGKKFGEMKL